MNRSLRYLLLVILCTFSAPAQWITTPEFDGYAQRGINAVYNLEFEKAEKEFTALSSKYPSHPAGKFFLAMIEWWRIMMNMETEELDERFIGRMDDVIALCDSLLRIDENNVGALFFKGGALGFQGRLRANRSSWFSAANAGRKALPVVQKAYTIAPENHDILLGIGIYNYYAATIPEKYPIVKPVMVFFPEGNKEQGIAQLQRASEKARFAAIEAKYFLLQLNYNYERRYHTSYELSTSLLRQFPNNVVFHRYVGRSAYLTARYGEAQSMFEQILRRCDRQQRGYSPYAKREALYYLGMVALNMAEGDKALTFFRDCERLSRELDAGRESPFLAMCHLRTGMVFDMQQKRNHAIMQYQKVRSLPPFENSHELADEYLKKPYRP